MKHPHDMDWKFWTTAGLEFALIPFFVSQAHAHEWKNHASENRCLVRLDNRSVASVAIAADGTVLDFPIKPTKVILGRKNSFGIEYVESDLAISPLAPGSRSHLYVYLEGRRFTFDLSTTIGGGCAVIAVRDSKDNQVSVDGFFRPKK